MNKSTGCRDCSWNTCCEAGRRADRGHCPDRLRADHLRAGDRSQHKVTFTDGPSTLMFGTLDGSKNVTGTLGDGATSSKRVYDTSGSHSIGFTNTVGGSAPCSTAFPA